MSPLATDELAYSEAQIRRARTLLAALVHARQCHRLYPQAHPANVDARQRLADTVSQYHAERVDVVLTFLDGEVRLGSHLLVEESVLFDQFIRDLEGMNAGSLIIRQGVGEEDLIRLVGVLAADPIEIEKAQGAPRLLASRGADRVTITEVRALEDESTPEESDEAARAAYDGALALMRDIDEGMREGIPPSGGRVQAQVRLLVDNLRTNRAALLRVSGLKDYDEYTYYHSANVAILSLALGSAITNDQRFLASLGAGALLHDIGKLSIDVKVLNKPGAYDEREWDLMRRHPVVGAQKIATSTGMDTSAIVMILEHHMRLDGSGYPLRTPARRQHLTSRIVAVADTYDAMTSKRPYSAAWPQDAAMAALAECAGLTLDRALVRLFIRVLGVYPPRSIVRLDDGRTAIVLKANETDPLRPLVRVFAAQDGSLIERHDLDLGFDPSVSISRCLDAETLNITVEDYL